MISQTNPSLPTRMGVAASLPPSVKSACREKTVNAGWETGVWAPVIVGYDLEFIPPDTDLQEARAILAASMLPAKGRDLRLALAKLFVSTVSREGGETDLKFLGETYAERLCEHAGDIVIDVLRDRQVHGPKWHPTLPELIEMIEKLERPRVAMIAAISPEGVRHRRDQVERERQDEREMQQRDADRLKFLAENPDWEWRKASGETPRSPAIST